LCLFLFYMAIKVQYILDILQQLAPEFLAASWDNVGLVLGNPTAEVQGILLALDPSLAVLEEAQRLGTQVLITHHPAIFQALKQIRTDQIFGRLLNAALQSKINLIACHTNLDATRQGVSDVLAASLGLQETLPLLPDPTDGSCGIGRLGSLPEALSAEALLQTMQRTLSLPWLLEAGPRPQSLRRIALCGGSGSDLAERALAAGAEVFLTAEVKHHTARWAEEAGLWLLDGGHFATEWPVLALLRNRLHHALADHTIQIHISQQNNPLRLAEFTHITTLRSRF
jgi:dinuclear metal center YbgI/SA1388 family protein